MPGVYYGESLRSIGPGGVTYAGSCGYIKEYDMSALLNEVADLIYTADNPLVPWQNALPDDKAYYSRIADVVVDAVVSHLRERDDSFQGAFGVTIEYLTTETDVARLRRSVT